jgi:hypothetical protein
VKDTIASIAPVMPSATPSDEEIRAWEALPRGEQLLRLRAALTQPDCAIATSDTMADILAEATAHSDLGRG